MSWALCTQHPSWLPPSTLCTLEKSFTSYTRRQYCHWTIRAAIMFPSKCIFRNNIISWIQGCIFQLHRRPFSLLSDSLQTLGCPCFVPPRALKSLHPLLHLILCVCWRSREDSLQIVRNWPTDCDDSERRGISWFSSLSFPLSHALAQLLPLPLGHYPQIHLLH